MAKILNILSHSEEETCGLAEKLVPTLRPNDMLVLSGELGSGKTVFVRGLAAGLGLDSSKITSPSFAIVHEYPGSRPLFHFDLYRVAHSDELYEVGWEEYLNRDGLVVVEWGEKAAELLPDNYYLIEFTIAGDSDRKICISIVQP